jgi:putative nucleotidyltransferase with HDIG domain
VGNMVEAAAKSIGANSLLARVAAYYHDIGKINKTQYFVENQAGGENKHERLAPSMSSLILISHVKDGLDLARKYRLGPNIENIIQQHHGTSVISFFYQKALDLQKKIKNSKGGEVSPVLIEDYRYPGPKPQTKEAGLVLLADAVEAASRTLSDPTAARIQGLVQKIINKIFSDGQLDECELTLKDLHQIAKSFIQIIMGIAHQRIEYPEPATKGLEGKARANGDPGQRPTKRDRDGTREDRGEGEEDLKRLGIS